MKVPELKNPSTDNPVASLLKAITTLINLCMLYLAIKWSWTGLAFMIGAIT